MTETRGGENDDDRETGQHRHGVAEELAPVEPILENHSCPTPRPRSKRERMVPRDDVDE